MQLQRYTRESLPAFMAVEVRKYERQFALKFDAFTYFSAETLGELHAPDLAEVLEASLALADTASIEAAADILSRVANSSKPSPEARREYLGALLEIYRSLPESPVPSDRDHETYFVGVEREGRILGEQLHWLGGERSMRVHAKRMRVNGGLLVGLAGAPAPRECKRLVIVDGAIASGATLIAIIDKLSCANVHIYSAHAALEGARALSRFAASRSMALRISAGFVTGGLNQRYYAHHEGRPVVGDLGDTIAELFLDA